MKKQFLFTLLLVIPLINGCSITKEDENIIKIAVTDMGKDSILSLKNKISEIDENINIEILEYKDASTINYFLNHNKLDCDLIALEEFNDSKIYSNKLYLLNRFEGINKLSNDVVTHIKDSKGNIYSIPAPGRFYCNILNLDLFNEYNIPIYNTIDELKNIPLIENKEVFTTTFTNSMLDCLMQLSIPTFLSSVDGSRFINEYYDGNIYIKGSKYENIYKNIFSNLYDLYQNNFFSKELNKGDLYKFYEGNAFITSIVYNEDASKLLKDNNVSFNYLAYPFVGYNVLDKWIATKPQFYLSIVNKSSLSYKKETIFKFLNYFMSKDGQEALITSSKGVKLANAFSYLNNSNFELFSPYNSLSEYIDSGKVYIVDTIRSLYFKIFDPLIKYLSDESSIEQLILEVDEVIKTRDMSFNKIYYFDKLNNLKGKNKDELNTINKYFSSLISEYLEVFDSYLPSPSILNYIYEGYLYANEVEVIVDKTLDLSLIEINGYDLFMLIDEFKEEFSSLNINYKKNSINNKKIEDEKIYEVVVPTSILTSINASDASIKSTFKINKVLKEIFDTMYLKVYLA